jgi:hypothetical protein
MIGSFVESLAGAFYSLPFAGFGTAEPVLPVHVTG